MVPDEWVVPGFTHAYYEATAVQFEWNFFKQKLAKNNV